MSKLVCDDVRFGEIAGRAESLAQFVEKPEVEIHVVICRTVERAAGRLRKAARRLNSVAEQAHFRRLIAVAKELLPCALGVAHDDIDEVNELLFFGRTRDGTRRADSCRRRGASSASEEREKVHASRPAED